MSDLILPIDSKGLFLLPQYQEDTAYYVYGSPGNGMARFAHQRMITFLMHVQFEWSKSDSRKIGVGNITLMNGLTDKDHQSHKAGLDVDIRPIRKDGKELPTTCKSVSYDRHATLRLVQIMQQTGLLRTILFNDSLLPGVKPWVGHDDHLHISLRSA